MMNIFKNVIGDGSEYNQLVEKYHSTNKLHEVERVEINKVITITLEEYKELLVYKGKYLGIVDSYEKVSIYKDGVKTKEDSL